MADIVCIFVTLFDRLTADRHAAHNGIHAHPGLS
jgi:hypothetical protein